VLQTALAFNEYVEILSQELTPVLLLPDAPLR
jgi:hypothetical protein